MLKVRILISVKFWVLLLCCCLFFEVGCDAASGKAELIMNELFGVTDDLSRRKLKPLWNDLEDMVHAYDLRFLRTPELRWFTVDAGFDRRLLFHWGYSMRASSLGNGVLGMALQRKIDQDKERWLDQMKKEGKSTHEIGRFRSSHKGLFYAVIAKEQEERAKRLAGKVTEVTKIRGTEAKWIANIIYNCYILQQYGSSKGVLADRSVAKKIIDEVMEEGFGKIVNRGGYTVDVEYPLKNKIRPRLEAGQRGSGRGLDEAIRSFSDAVRSTLPQTMNICFPFLKERLSFTER